MRTVAFLIAIAIAIAPTMAIAARPGGGGGGMRGGGGGGMNRGGGINRGGAPASRPSSNQGHGFNLGNDVPSTRGGSNGNRQGNANGNNRQGNANGNNRQGNANGNNRQGNVSGNNGNKNNNGNNNKNNNGNNNKNNNGNNNKNNNGNNNKNNNGNNNNVNRNNGNTYNNTHVNNYTYNSNGYNGYGWHGAVVVNPVYRGGAWGWNRGVVWAPNYGYWGGGFWGAFAVGATTAAVMGSLYYNNQTYPSYQVSTGSPGATLLGNYGLQQVPCGPPGLVVIYGPNNGVICANPNGRVAAGSYAVNENDLTLQSQQ